MNSSTKENIKNTQKDTQTRIIQLGKPNSEPQRLSRSVVQTACSTVQGGLWIINSVSLSNIKDLFSLGLTKSSSFSELRNPVLSRIYNFPPCISDLQSVPASPESLLTSALAGHIVFWKLYEGPELIESLIIIRFVKGSTK